MHTIEGRTDTTKKSVFVTLALALLLTITSISLLAGCLERAPEAELIEAPYLLGDVHGKIIYTTYTLDEEVVDSVHNLYTVTFKDLRIIDLDSHTNNTYILIDLNIDDEMMDSRFYELKITTFYPSPDRNSIVFNKEDGLHIFDIRNKDIRGISETQGGFIAWHPDGQLLAYVDNRDLFTINVDGTGKRKIAEHNSGIYTFPSGDEGKIEGCIARPTWIMNGSILLYYDFTAPPQYRQYTWPTSIYAYDFENQKIGSFYEYLAEDEHLPWDPMIAYVLTSSNQRRDGHEVVVTGSSSEWHSVFRFDETRDEWVEEDYMNVSCKGGFLLSPIEGRFLSFLSVDDNELEYFDNGERLRIHLDGLLEEAWGGAWSPDGKYVAVNGNNGNDNRILILEPTNQEVAVMDCDIDPEEYMHIIAWY